MKIRFGTIDFKNRDKLLKTQDKLHQVNSAFQTLDDLLMSYEDQINSCEYKQEALRALALCRTNLEISSMYANKTIVLSDAGNSDGS